MSSLARGLMMIRSGVKARGVFRSLCMFSSPIGLLPPCILLFRGGLSPFLEDPHGKEEVLPETQRCERNKARRAARGMQTGMEPAAGPHHRSPPVGVTRAIGGRCVAVRQLERAPVAREGLPRLPRGTRRGEHVPRG